jgi:transcriptional regulator with XRE-family HTH domain
MVDHASSMKDEQLSDINTRIARRVRELRAAQGFTLAALASRSGVSRSMISLIERGEASPTAVVLERLATGLGVALAALFDAPRADVVPDPLVRRAQQLQWRDPASGYLRRNVSPPHWPSPLQVVEVEFPAGARVAYETGARDLPVHQQVWVLDGTIDVTLGDEWHRLEAGDCLAMQLDQPIVYSNPTHRSVRYVVAITTERVSLSRVG